MVLLRFNHIVDLRRVVDLGPWSFDQNLLVLRELKSGETPTTVDLRYVDFWIHVTNLSVSLFSATVGKALGDYVESFLEYDVNNIFMGPESYMRVRVRIDVRLPLKREKKVRKAGGETVTCKFQYERLPDFCYICGKMGHTDKYCEVLFRVPEDKIVRMWDKELRAPPRKAKGREGERLLSSRDSKDSEGGSGIRGRGEVGRWSRSGEGR
ncbi:hypothetical protein LINPERHAP1_LOCUS15167 [Linum perenne]